MFLKQTLDPLLPLCQDRHGNFFVNFLSAVSQKRETEVNRTSMREGCFSQRVEELARVINPIIQGWSNYFSRVRCHHIYSI